MPCSYQAEPSNQQSCTIIQSGIHLMHLPFPSHQYYTLLSLKLILSYRESSLQKLSLLLGVAGLQSGGHTGTWVTSSIHNVLAVMKLGLVQQSLDSGLGETPSTGVQWLFLTPDNSLGVLVAVEVLLELLPWEGVQLFNSSDGGVLEVVVGTVFVQSSVDLTRAENDTVDFLWLSDGLAVFRVGNDPLELGITGELLDWRTGKRVSQERLGEEDDKGYDVLA